MCYVFRRDLYFIKNMKKKNKPEEFLIKRGNDLKNGTMARGILLEKFKSQVEKIYAYKEPLVECSDEKSMNPFYDSFITWFLL